MADEQTQSAEEQQAQVQAEPVETTDWKAEARKWEARAKENKAKADAYDEAQEAAKSDLQKALERAEKAEAESKALRDEKARNAAVKAAAASYGVDEETLSRMGGDIDSNAAFLKAKQDAKPPAAYPQVKDNGEIQLSKPLTLEEIDRIEDYRERLAAYGRFYSDNI